MPNQCYKCEVSEEEKDLKKCVICFKYYCEECGWNRAGRTFCTKQCSDFFFFGDED